MSVLIDAFVAQMDGLLEFINKRFPEDKDIYITRTKFNTAAAFCPRLVVAQFMSEVWPYMEELKARNESFFLHMVKTDYDHVVGHMDLAGKWNGMSEAERETMWTRIDQLVQIGQRVISK